MLWNATAWPAEERVLLGDALEAVAVRAAEKPDSPWAILRYDHGQTITRGQGHAIEAHHIIEQRHLEFWQLPVDTAPSVILSKEDHTLMTNLLEQRLPKNTQYSREQVWIAYQEVYAEYPEWLDAIRSYFIP